MDLKKNASHNFETIEIGFKMSRYKFDWQDVIHGHIEVEAESGVVSSLA